MVTWRHTSFLYSVDGIIAFMIFWEILDDLSFIFNEQQLELYI